jgi:hypothetical protein
MLRFCLAFVAALSASQSYAPSWRHVRSLLTPCLHSPITAGYRLHARLVTASCSLLAYEQYTPSMQTSAKASSSCMDGCPMECRRRAGLLFFGKGSFSASDHITASASPRIRNFVFFYRLPPAFHRLPISVSSGAFPPRQAPASGIRQSIEVARSLCYAKKTSGARRGMIGRRLHKAREHRRDSAFSTRHRFPAPSIPPPALWPCAAAIRKLMAVPSLEDSLSGTAPAGLASRRPKKKRAFRNATSGKPKSIEVVSSVDRLGGNVC